MKEDFAYSKARHDETTIKPARRKARNEMLAALAVAAALAFLAVNGIYLHWF